MLFKGDTKKTKNTNVTIKVKTHIKRSLILSFSILYVDVENALVEY